MGTQGTSCVKRQPRYMLLSEINGLFCSRNSRDGDGFVGDRYSSLSSEPSRLCGVPEVSVIIQVILKTGRQQPAAGSDSVRPFLPKKYVSVG